MPDFAHRAAAGEVLADHLAAQSYREPVVVAIPKGGVPVAAPLARRWGLALELCLVAKVPIPWRREAGIGALAADGTLKLNRELIHVLAMEEAVVRQGLAEAWQAMGERKRAFGAFAQPPAVEGKTLILVDDGLATGYTALTAVEVLQELGPERMVVAAPVGSIYAVETLAEAGLEVVVLASGDGPFFDVASYYRDFEELDDAEVLRLLADPPRTTVKAIS